VVEFKGVNKPTFSTPPALRVWTLDTRYGASDAPNLALEVKRGVCSVLAIVQRTITGDPSPESLLEVRNDDYVS